MHLRLAIASLTVAAALPSAAHAGDPRAEIAFRNIVEAYRNADALVDQMEYVVHMPGAEPHEDGFTIVFGPDDLVGVDYGSLIAVSRDRTMYFAADAPDGPYLQAPHKGTYDAAFQTLLGGATRIPSPPHVFMRENAPQQEILTGFGFGLLGIPEFTGFDEVTRDGRNWIRFEAQSDRGTLEILADPKTHFVHRMSLQALAGGSPDQGKIKAEVQFNPRTETSTNSIRAFTTDGRIRVDSVMDLMNVGPKIGSTAPDLEFERPNGDRFDLSDLSGKVVVIDFWATWCGNCFFSLPDLQKVADWADQQGLDVEFLCVNSREKHETRDERVAAATTWWNSLNLSLPWVIDVDDEASRAFRASSFPALIVIDHEGVITYAHSGYDANLRDHLKDELTKLHQAH